MIKKRIIFTLLLSEKNFILSRNFVHQKVGDINWLKKNYNFKSTSNFIDELVIINVARVLIAMCFMYVFTRIIFRVKMI